MHCVTEGRRPGALDAIVDRAITRCDAPGDREVAESVRTRDASAEQAKHPEVEKLAAENFSRLRPDTTRPTLAPTQDAPPPTSPPTMEPAGIVVNGGPNSHPRVPVREGVGPTTTDPAGSSIPRLGRPLLVAAAAGFPAWARCGTGFAVLGAPGRTRTCGLEIRSLLLYPSELRGPASVQR